VNVTMFVLLEYCRLLNVFLLPAPETTPFAKIPFFEGRLRVTMQNLVLTCRHCLNRYVICKGSVSWSIRECVRRPMLSLMHGDQLVRILGLHKIGVKHLSFHL